MSTVKLTGATSGTISLVPTAIAGSNTITFPAETGTARTTVSTGTVLQQVNYQTGAVATGTTLIPLDDSIPQNTEGDQYMSLAITPKSATSILEIEVVVNMAQSGGVNNVIVALFQDSTASALASNWSYRPVAGGSDPLSLSYRMTSGTTSATTFKVRAGGQSAATYTLNGSASARLFGGTLFSSITITEVVP